LGLALQVHAQRIAVVGSGISGSSTTFFLHQLLPQANLEVFEAAADVGGRAYTISEFGHIRIDAGATAISTLNRYLVSIVHRFNLTHADDGVGELGLWDGGAFRFRWSEGRLLPLRMLARYGFNPLRIINAVRGAVSKLTSIYDLQDKGVSFATPAEMFQRLGLSDLTQRSGYELFDALGVDKRFVEELVDAASRDNYGQPSTINSFVDLVSLAGAGVSGSVFSLRDGTSQIPRALLESCSDRTVVHTNTRVSLVESLACGDFRLEFVTQASKRVAKEFDAVVIATPLETAMGLELRGSRALNSTRPFQQTCVTFVAGTVDPAYFGLGSRDMVPTEILTVANNTLPFRTLAVHGELGNNTYVYKLFSDEILADSLLDRVFKHRFQTWRHTWQAAYPKLLPTPPATWPPFEVPLESSVPGRLGSVLYTGAMESPVSCMETQIIAAKNAALRTADLLRHQSRMKNSWDATFFA